MQLLNFLWQEGVHASARQYMIDWVLVTLFLVILNIYNHDVGLEVGEQ